jgi:hypothetical protein
VKKKRRTADEAARIEFESARLALDAQLIAELHSLRMAIECEASAGRRQTASMIAPLLRLEDGLWSLRRAIEYGTDSRLGGIERAIYIAAREVATRPPWPVALWNRCVSWVWRRKFDRQAARRAKNLNSVVDKLPTCDAWGDPHK